MERDLLAVHVHRACVADDEVDTGWFVTWLGGKRRW